MKLAFVCDWLTGTRGGERCLAALCDAYPNADIFTLIHVPGTVSEKIESHRIVTSFLQDLPGNPRRFRWYLPLFPKAVERFRLEGYDLVLSLSHCVAKGAIAPKGVPHLCYCHTPARYAWQSRDVYLASVSPLLRPAAALTLKHLRRWDRKSSHRVTEFITTSNYVADRIRRAYDRTSAIIHPPVDCDRFRVSEEEDGTYLVVSALVPYKRIDVAVEAFRGLDRRLVVIGEGPELPKLRAVAPGNVTFTGHLPDAEVTRQLARCRALVFPTEEDFGIVPMEANASGKPVIAYGGGGALETVAGLDEANRAGTPPTGLFFHHQTPQALRDAIGRFEAVRGEFDPAACRRNALRFDRSLFISRFQQAVDAITS